MAISKIQYKANASATPETWMDVTDDSVTAGTLLSGETATQANGVRTTGTYTAPVSDVQVNGTSVVSSGVANIPLASSSAPGTVVVTDYTYGLAMENDGNLRVYYANGSQVKAGTEQYRPIVPLRQDASTFYGLAKAAGNSDQSSSENAVGVYTSDALVKIQKMLGVYEAPWELIRDDSVTNATEATVTINTDSNGNTFDLTDVRMQISFPTQNNEAKFANGAIMFYYNSNYDYIQGTVDVKTVTANSTMCGAYALITQSPGMVLIQTTSWHNSTVLTTLRMPMKINSTDKNFPFFITQNEIGIKSIVMTKVTGTLDFRIYGKRKWRT